MLTDPGQIVGTQAVGTQTVGVPQVQCDCEHVSWAELLLQPCFGPQPTPPPPSTALPLKAFGETLELGCSCVHWLQARGLLSGAFTIASSSTLLLRGPQLLLTCGGAVALCSHSLHISWKKHRDHCFGCALKLQEPTGRSSLCVDLEWGLKQVCPRDLVEQPCAGTTLTQSSRISCCNNYVDEDLAWQTVHSGQKYTVINFCDLKAQDIFWRTY